VAYSTVTSSDCEMIAYKISIRLYPVRADLGTLGCGTSHTFYLLLLPAGTPGDNELRVLICTRPSGASSLEFSLPIAQCTLPIGHCPIHRSRHLTTNSLDPIGV